MFLIDHFIIIVVIQVFLKISHKNLSVALHVLGKLYCEKCHKLDMSVIPCRVLYKLDCRPSKVCRKAKTFLDGIYSIPCLEMKMFDNKIIDQNQKLQKLKMLMSQLRTMK